VLLVWIFYSAQIILFGAEFTQVYARSRGSDIEPSKHAVRVVKTIEEQPYHPQPETVSEPASEPAPHRQSKYGSIIAILGSIVTLAGCCGQVPSATVADAEADLDKRVDPLIPKVLVKEKVVIPSNFGYSNRTDSFSALAIETVGLYPAAMKSLQQ
jgi:hypothetical protein